MFTISTAVPVPPKAAPKHVKRALSTEAQAIYDTLREMEIGQSFLIPDLDAVKAKGQALRVGKLASRVGKEAGVKYAVRTAAQDGGLRVWRIEPKVVATEAPAAE